MNRFCFVMILVLAANPLSASTQDPLPTAATEEINRIAKELRAVNCQVEVNPQFRLGLSVKMRLRNVNNVRAELEKTISLLDGFAYRLFLSIICVANPPTTVASDVDFSKLCDLRIERLSIHGIQLTSSQVKCICRIKSLAALRIQHATGIDEGLRSLSNLTSLYLFDTDVSDACLDSIPRLQFLGIEGGRVTGVGLSKLRDLNGLVLKSPALTNEGLAVIGSLSKLTHLTLNISDQVDSSGLVELTRLPILSNLNIEVSERTTIVAKEPSSLVGFPQLTRIVIEGPGSSETVCELLSGLSVAKSANLELVFLNCPNLDDEVFRQLRECKTNPFIGLTPCNVSEEAFADFKNNYRGKVVKLSEADAAHLRESESKINDLRKEGGSSPGLILERDMLRRGEGQSGK